MTTLYLPTQRQPFFKDRNGRWSTYKDKDSVQQYTIDWGDMLGSDTISTSTWEQDDGNATADSSSNTTTTTSATVSDTDGTLKNTITTAGGYTYVRRLRFLGKEK